VNSVCLVGKLTRHPLVRFEGEGSQVTTFTLAITEPSREGKAFTLYVPCVAWGRSAEACGTLSREDLIALSGKLCWRKQTDKQGQEKSSLAVNVRELRLLVAAEVLDEPTAARPVGW